MLILIVIVFVVLIAAGFVFLSKTGSGENVAHSESYDDNDPDDDPDDDADAPEEKIRRAPFLFFLKHGREIEVAGESHKNRDGSSRQKIIAKLDVGDMVALRRDPENDYDPDAVEVWSPKGMIGFVSRKDGGTVAGWMDGGENVVAYVSSIAGGPEEGQKYYGVWLRVLTLNQVKAASKAEENETV